MASQRRMIYDTVYANTELNLLSIETRHLYIGTIVLADDDGRLRADPRYLRGRFFSYDDKITTEAVEKMLQSLADIKQIIIYERDGVQVLKHPNWKKYQRIRADLYVPSKLPSQLRERNDEVTETVLNISKDKVSKEDSGQAALIPEIIKSFEEINPASKKFYGNTTQRKAAQELIDTYGFEKVKNVVLAVLPKTNGMQYFPTIISPLQLRDKWATLEAAVKKSRPKNKATEFVW